MKNKFFILRLAFGLTIFFLLLWKIDAKNVVNQIRNANLFYYLLASFSFTLAIYFSTLRWKIFLQVFNPGIGTLSLLKAYFLGIFFGNFLPSGGIDLIRGVYLFNKSSKSEIFASILVDRYMGFIFLSTISLLGLPLIFRNLNPFAPYIIIFSILIISLFVLSFSKPFYNVIKRYSSSIPFVGGIVTRLYSSYFAYRNKPIAMLSGLWMSFLVQTFFYLAVHLCAMAIGKTIPVFESYISLTVINILSLIPITVAGIGVREGGFILFFTGLGILSQIEAFTLSLLYFSTSIINSIPGFLVFVREGYQAKAG